MAPTKPRTQAPLKVDPVPPVDDLLDEIDHPLLAKASEQFVDPATSRTRIASVDDNVLFKVKVNRW